MTPTHEEQVRSPAIATPSTTVAEPAQRAPAAQFVPGMGAGAIQGLHALAKTDPKDAHLALRYIERSATSGLRELEESTPATRDGIVAKIALEVLHASEALFDLIQGLSAEKQSDLRTAANAAVEALHEVKAWIVSREPHAEMLATFEIAVRAIAPALQSMNVQPIAARRRVDLNEGEAQEATAEKDKVLEAAANLKDAIDAESLQLISGVGAFSDLASIDDSSPPSLI